MSRRGYPSGRVRFSPPEPTGSMYLTQGIWRKIRAVLGRVGSGCTVAAIPWAGTLVAATQGACLWIVTGALATGLIMLWTFAPGIPGLRDLLPAKRRVSALETFWARGHALDFEPVTSDSEYEDWCRRVDEWTDEVALWIDKRLSPVDLRLFAKGSYNAGSRPRSYSETHNRVLGELERRLTELLRMREAQERKLR